MDFTDMKLYFINGLALVVTSTDIEMSLKIILLICTIVYTIIKTKKLTDKKNDWGIGKHKTHSWP